MLSGGKEAKSGGKMEKKRDYNRVTKEEMNLVEYPFQYLGRIVPDEVKTIEWSDEIIDKNGERVIAKWIVTGSDKYGLPRMRDRDVLLGLLYYWKLQGFQSPLLVINDVPEFLELLRIPKNGYGYEFLEESLKRITGVTIIARYSFWDNETKDYFSEVTFHILDMARVDRGKGRNTIVAKASDIFWRSIQSGYIKNLNLDFYLSLETPTAKALYCYLDKKAYGKSHFEIEIGKLASHLGMIVKDSWNIKKLLKRHLIY